MEYHNFVSITLMGKFKENLNRFSRMNYIYDLVSTPIRFFEKMNYTKVILNNTYIYWFFTLWKNSMYSLFQDYKIVLKEV